MNRRTFLTGALLAAAAPVPTMSAAPAPARNGTGTQDDGKGILALNPPETVLPILQNMRLPAIRVNKKGHPIPQEPPLTLLHFADIHNDAVNLRRVMAFYNHYRRYFDDALVTGDIAGGTWREYSPEMDAAEGFSKVLKTLGNHDNFRWNPSTMWAPAKACYERYFKGIESWGVVQPGGNNPDGLCYWYKDYPKSRVRLVGLDCMHYDAAQNSWFAAVLADARGKGLAVVAAQHYPPMGKKDVTGFPGCAFDSLQRESLGAGLPKAVKEVDLFQKAGGEFVCWLGGHTHTDFCGTVNGTGQMFICVGIAKNMELWCDSRRVTGEKSQDLFNAVSIDTCRRHVRVLRIGAEWNRFLQHRVTMCLDYENRVQLT